MDLSAHGIGHTTRGTGFPIVLLHGFSVDHRSMVRAFEPAFADDPDWLRIYVDLPGMGASRPLQPRTTDEVMDHLVEFLADDLQLERFAVAGASYGGSLALALVSAMPARIAGIALVAPAVILDHAARDLPVPVVFERDDELLAGVPDDVAEAFADAVVQDRAAFAYFSDVILPAMRVADADEWVAELWERGYVPRRYAVAPDRAFAGPSLLVAGRQDSVVGYRDQLALADLLPRTTLAVLDYSGHSPEVERAQLFRALVCDWLERLRKERSTS